MTRSKRAPHERSAELRQLLGCGETERTTDAAKRLLRRNGELRALVEHLERTVAEQRAHIQELTFNTHEYQAAGGGS